MRPNSLLLAALLAAALAAAQEEAGRRYTPPSQTFACDLPEGWQAFEEEEPFGFAVHILGPDNPAGTYRIGIDVRYYEKGQPGWLPVKKKIDVLRRADKLTDRNATPVQAMRIGGTLSRLFQVHEARRLPLDQAPSLEEPVHHYVAVVPTGENYHVIRLSSTRDVYQDYRSLFVDFLRSFRPLGVKL